VSSLSKLPRDKKVMLEIEKIEQRKREKEYRKGVEEQLKSLKEQQQKQRAKKVSRRKFELGVSYNRKKQPAESSAEEEIEVDVLILDENETLPEEREKLRKKAPEIKLLDIKADEEERDRLEINLWLGRYRKLFKNLFGRYVDTIRSHKQHNFEEQSKKLMNLAEINMLAKDHSIYPDLLSREELQALVRAINIRLRKRTEDQHQVDLDGLEQLFVQLAYKTFGKKRQKTIDCLKDLMKHMGKAMMYKGESVVLYEDPEYVVGLDKRRLAELNA